ncbi:glycosyltransferase [Haliovirga abyssi]|uniref:Glycosyltransferase 2-like domain-containing protein n=1 Tax=Haliovirga abyssi TaxID=2996794 RepID=A0AAU9E056_9FUSO|nr:glycosyltransferase [Haliovirga abyssi]BDU49680.1 hypothetical protein HLVA_02490 [Haliovirga abyssi]
MKISVSMITYNEENKLEKTLKSVYNWVDEIVIVDSYSSDKTVEIAKKYGAKVYIEDWKGFGKQKNSALEKCTGDWILLIDADEEITENLRDEILNIINSDKIEKNVYKIPRISWWFGKKTHEKDSVIRLVKKDSGKYNEKEVHEEFVTKENIGVLKNSINHYTYVSLEEYFMKFNKYTTLAALELRKKGRKFNLGRLFFEPIRNFLKIYIGKKGILEGYYGFLRAILSGMYGIVRYSKLYLLEKENPNILISRTDKIGDLVLSVPSFSKIRNMYPNAKIAILVRNYNYDIVKNLPYIDEVIKIDDYSEKELIKKIRKFNANIFIALFTNKFIGKLSIKSKAKYRIGPYSKLHSFFSYNKGVFQKRSKSIKNEAEYNLDLIKRVDGKLFYNSKDGESKIYLGESNKKLAEKFYVEKRINKKLKTIVIHPFSGGSAKNLTIEQYIELIKRIKQELDINVVVTGGIGDKAKIDYFRKKIIDVNYFIGKRSILDLAAIINKGDIFIGSSTGPTHIAGILGKDIVAIYPKIKAQSKIRWGVLGNGKVEYIEPEENCKEKYKCNEKCEYYDCFSKIKLEKIVIKIKKIIDEE